MKKAIVRIPKNKKFLRVLVACEYSGLVREAFRAKGHYALSCDFLPTDIPGEHYQGDVFDIIDDDWDMMIAFPPCTHLCLSGARWFPQKIADGRQQEGIDFFMKLVNADIPMIAIENPVGIMSKIYRKPDQIIVPYIYGENSTKGTCLWLKNLPKLKPSNVIVPEKHTTKTGKSYDKWWFATCLISDLTLRAKVRSKTFEGIGHAMSSQWG